MKHKIKALHVFLLFAVITTNLFGAEAAQSSVQAGNTVAQDLYIKKLLVSLQKAKINALFVDIDTGYVLLPHPADWRWGHGKTSPLAPNVKLLRQDKQGDWNTALNELKIVLKNQPQPATTEFTRALHPAELMKKVGKPYFYYHF